ncbi:Protein of unknown function [Microlunatus soli]|uniref:Intracellular septation protein A n=2 Tax=Microlunatus soli TaxID=630515 RepID=A0A1H1V193_9ACTN|nr:Protein of unknown function [Microlunatus soli]
MSSTLKDHRDHRVLDQLGGPLGLMYSVVPVIVFVVADVFLPLPLTIGVSLAAGVALFVIRLARRERVVSAIGSLAGVAVAAGIVAWTGSSRDFFVLGIWGSLAGFVLTAVSVLVRRPVTGVIWNAVHGGRHAWRTDRGVLRAHDLATGAVALVFGARFVIQQWLYLEENTGGLGIAHLVLGTPLTVLAVAAVVWAIRRSAVRMTTAATPASTSDLKGTAS